ncbi:MAG: hypothetical protein JRC77_08250 [Deltaproteobacteria bacterium]|nr:hypothetical protein [Deltaproteobacteria bacterium]
MKLRNSMWRTIVGLGFFSIVFVVIGWVWVPLEAKSAENDAKHLEGNAWTGMSVEDREKMVQQKLMLLKSALGGSSAERIVSGGDMRANLLLSRARQAFAEADSALNSGELALAEELGDEALQSLSSASRITSEARRGQEVDHRARYEEMREGMAAFRQSLDQALGSDESGSSVFDREALNALSTQAETLAAADRYAEAEELMSRAYAMTVVALSEARKNQTVVYSRDLSTPQDVYAYELERNRSYNSLVEHLLAKGETADSARKLVDRYLSEAQAFRVEAETRVQEDDYESATEAMEKATTLIIRALKLMGVPASE